MFISLRILFQCLDINVVCHQQCHEKSREKNVVCAIGHPQAIKLLFQTVSKHCKIQGGRARCQSRCLNSHCCWLHNSHTHRHTHKHTHACAHTCTDRYNACTHAYKHARIHTHIAHAHAYAHHTYTHYTCTSTPISKIII